jgi:SAM-dependent methyltransferase
VVFVIAHRVDVEGLQKHLMMERVAAGSHMMLFKACLSDIDTERGLKASGRTIIKLMDRFWFVLADKGELQEAVFAEFFEYIADEYERLIDVSRNVENIETLLSQLSTILGNLADQSILDFGCGTGLGIGPLTAFGTLFTGVDQAAHMRDLARKRGMPVISMDQLQSRTSAFHGVIASYVFHLFVDEFVFDQLWNTVRIGGALVANFHKGSGIERANAFFRRSDCRIVECEVAPHLQRHGSYLAYIKQ